MTKYLTIEENKIKIAPIYPHLYHYDDHVDIVDEVFARHENFDFILLELNPNLPRKIFWDIVEGRWDGNKSVYYYLALYLAREANLKIFERIYRSESELLDLFSFILEGLHRKALYIFITKQLSIQLFIKKWVMDFIYLQCPICKTSSFYKKSLGNRRLKCKCCKFSLNPK